ncbi:MAG TPA: hypothetical protein VGQ81_03075 [Acidobacteriota bacterium]|jgi:hypothetical protein|nr:hypothetical protein [Acidobacteriota bacterium]
MKAINQPGTDSRTGNRQADLHYGNIHTFVIFVPALFAVSLLAVVFHHQRLDEEIQHEVMTTRTVLTQSQNASRAQLLKLQSELAAAERRLATTQLELDGVRSLAEQRGAKQERNSQRHVAQISQETNSRELRILQRHASAQIGSAFQNAGSVKTDTSRLKVEPDNISRNLAQVGGLVEERGKLIATNDQGIQALRRGGGKDYFVFAINKHGKAQPVRDVIVELHDTDSKRDRADIRIQLNDTKLEKNKVRVNDPIELAAGPDGPVYEIVVNQVFKDNIRGYVSVAGGRPLPDTAKQF